MHTPTLKGHIVTASRTTRLPATFNRDPKSYTLGTTYVDDFGLVHVGSYREVRETLSDGIKNGDATAHYRRFQEAALRMNMDVPELGSKVHDNCNFPWTAQEQPEPGQQISPQQQLNQILREHLVGSSELLRQLAHDAAYELFAPLAGSAEIDINEFAKQLSEKVTAALLGLPPEYATVMRDAVAEYEARQGQFDWLKPATAEYEAARDELFANPPQGEGLISALLAEYRAGRITLEQRNSLLWGGYAAAYGTTATGISLTVRNIFDAALEDYPRQTLDLRNWVAESMRLSPPMVEVPLVALKPLSYEGASVAKGDIFFASLQSANLDPKVYNDVDPLHYYPWRHNANRHLGYGVGQHICLGRHLADAVMVAALDVMAHFNSFEGYRVRRFDRHVNLVDVVSALLISKI